MRLRAAFLFPALLACGQPFWNPRLPALSTEPLDPSRSLSGAIYSLLLAPEEGPSGDHPVRRPVVLADSTLALSQEPFVDIPYGGKGFIQSRWSQDVQIAFSAAFADLWIRSRSPRPIDRAHLAGLPIRLGPLDLSACGPRLEPWCQTGATYVSLSAIGYNGDSTSAVVYRSTWCGPLCGTGTLFLFRRLPGCRWTLWDAQLLWIS